MLTVSAVPRLTHILKPVPKDDASTEWMQTVDDAHLSTWITCVGAGQLDSALPEAELENLAASLDLPSQFGGVGLQSLMRAADEELLGSWASITSDLITFFISKDLLVYSKLAEALDAMADIPGDSSNVVIIPAVETLLAVSGRAHAFLGNIPQSEIDFTPSLVMGERTVAIPGHYDPLVAPSRLELIVLLDPRTPADYATATCKHECAILKQSRHVRQAHKVRESGIMMQRALMLCRAGQCVMDTAKVSTSEVEVVATMDRPPGYEHLEPMRGRALQSLFSQPPRPPI
jgi:hypothetical protein